MSNKVAASMTASIVVDKSDILAQALKGLAQVQKELNDNKLELFFDVSDEKITKKIKEIQNQFYDKNFVIKLKYQGIDEAYDSIDKLAARIKDVISGKEFGSGNGKGIGNSIVDEKQLEMIVDLFAKIERHLEQMRKTISDVGDGEEFSPLLKMIKELSDSMSKMKLNLNLDMGAINEEKLNTKIAQANSRQLDSYRKLLDSMKKSKFSNVEMFKFFEPEDASVSELIGVYRNLFQRFEKDIFGRRKIKSKDIFKSEYKEIENARAAFNRANKSQNQSNPLGELFGGTDLTEVISQLGLVVTKLEEISKTALEFKDIFRDGFNVTASVEEIEKLTNRVKELEEELSKLKTTVPTATSNPIETNLSSEKKEDFRGESKTSADSSAIAIKDEVNAMEQVAENAEKASKGKEKFVKSNKNVKKSADESADSIEKETSALDEEKWNKNVKAIQDYMDANTELNNIKAKDKGTGRNARELENQTKKVEELEKVAIEARATLSSMINPHKAPIDDWNKWLEAMKQFDQATDGSAKSVAKLEDALRNMAESQVKKVSNTLSSSERYLNTLKPSEGNRSVKFEGVVQEYSKAVSALREFHTTLNATTPLTKEQSDKFEELANDVKKARIEIDKIPKALRGSDEDSRMKEIDKLTKYLDANTRISKDAKRQLQGYLNLLESGDPSVAVKEIHTAWTNVAVAERKAGREGKSFLDLLKDKTIGNRAAQLVSYYLSFTDIIRYAREGINVVKDLNTALTEMRKVSDESISRLKEFQKESFDLADGIGTTALEIQNSAADFMRLGYSLQEATKLSQDANIYANVGDMEIDEATEHMVSSIQAWQSEFKSTTEASEQIINRYNEVGNNFAITSADIGSAMERSAAALKAGGNDLNESIGLITAGNLIQQDADTTANALKVMSLRIRGSKAELEGMGETTDDLAESTSKLREQVKSLTGVDIMLDPNTYKSTAEIVQEIGAVWNNLTDVSQAATLELLAGKTRASTVSGLIENYETIEDVIKSCEESENSALEENQKYIDSVEGRLNLLKSQAQELAFVTIDDEALKKGISLLTGLLSLVTDLIDKIGLLSTVAIGAGGFGFFKNLD